MHGRCFRRRRRRRRRRHDSEYGTVRYGTVRGRGVTTTIVIGSPRTLGRWGTGPRCTTVPNQIGRGHLDLAGPGQASVRRQTILASSSTTRSTRDLTRTHTLTLRSYQKCAHHFGFIRTVRIRTRTLDWPQEPEPLTTTTTATTTTTTTTHDYALLLEGNTVRVARVTPVSFKRRRRR